VDVEEMLAGRSASIYAGGHTHLQLLRRFGDALYVNPGSVGLPLAAHHSSRFADYAIIEVESGVSSVELRRVFVDAEAVERAAIEGGMPHARQWAAILGRRIMRRNAEAIRASC
jgi:diadenosine tetraphosphatase ApaH/serine/threonine PP2A family protein phosphatase